MRILLSNDLTLLDTDSELPGLARGLRRMGHDVHCLLPDGGPPAGDWTEIGLRQVAWPGADPAAEKPSRPPVFEPGRDSCPTFFQLTDAQIVDYRETFRIHLDADVLQFDPQLIHAQHVWIQGHLALETGVPYVLTARGAELAAYENDARFRRYADEAVAGAARVLLPSIAVQETVARLFPHLDDRTLLVPVLAGPPEAWPEALTAVYATVLRERFG